MKRKWSQKQNNIFMSNYLFYDVFISIIERRLKFQCLYNNLLILVIKLLISLFNICQANYFFSSDILFLVSNQPEFKNQTS